ncbi:MAG: hypothetical protein WC538_07260 [Thermoanaerobaculia bacterium]|jgi:hypothetical protein
MSSQLNDNGPRRIHRADAIASLRSALLQLTDDQRSMCQVAAERGIFCHGFRQLTDDELRQRYDWLVSRYPTATRAELESMANLWQISRQVLEGVPLACDAQKLEHDTCNGWDDFTNEQLEGYHREIVGESVIVVA